MKDGEKKKIKRLLAGIALVLILLMLILAAYTVFTSDGNDIGTGVIGVFGLLIAGPVLIYLCVWSAKIMLQKGEKNKAVMEEALREFAEQEEEAPEEEPAGVTMEESLREDSGDPEGSV
ncbi:MAG: hypothetical protein IJP92_08105 [Lachnospiraceae bacterium]|nr:hypothetical protein [Lachnospiraceae bacterium]